MSERKRVLILGAAGRDFHDFNVAFRGDSGVEVVGFTAAQIPGIAERRYPSSLAGALYPDGIPIYPEERLEELCRSQRVDQVLFAYSDVPHQQVMHLASRAVAAGADFVLLGAARTMLSAPVPVIAVSAVRTGCGKSPTVRWIYRRVKEMGVRAVIIRHPMPYGDLTRQAVQRFAALADLDEHACTIEEREDYEPHLVEGAVVYAGVDYARIVDSAGSEADLLLWDGGNNDFPFLRPDLHLVLVDALRPGHETGYFPGEAVLRTADVVIIGKSEGASEGALCRLEASIRSLNAKAPIVRGGSPVTIPNPAVLRGKRVAVVEDGPTLTHGGMSHGAGLVAARAAGAIIVDPRPFAPPELQEMLARYPNLGPVLPAVGYQPWQVEALGQTLNSAPVDVIVSATPTDLSHVMALNKPVIRASYEFAELNPPQLSEIIRAFIQRQVRTTTGKA